MTTVVYTVAEVAEIMRCSDDSVYRLISSGDLHAFKVGKVGVRITGPVLEAYMAGETPARPHLRQVS